MNPGFLDIAEKNTACFFACRLPGTEEIICGDADDVADYGTAGFVIMPFHPEERPMVIPFGHNAKKNISYPWKKTCRLTTDKETHLSSVREAIAIINSGKVSKLVISRVETLTRNFRLSSLFLNLCHAYPQACVFCFGTPLTGIWAGASPELLLKSNGESLSTISLAGTRPAGTDESWSKKNQDEQQIVTNYITECFLSLGYSPEVSDTFVKNAGPVEHLCTEITCDSGKSVCDSLPFILSPTPALAGYPKAEAIESISRIEAHPRDCYGGFIGIHRQNKTFDFYVNLRSMNIDSEYCTLFSGGGITSDSNPETEWEETVNKAATLRNVILK